MPFYTNQSPSVLDPALFSAAQAGLARQYADEYGLKRGQIDLGYQQAANQRYATDAESQYRQSALTSQERLAQMQDAFQRAQLGQQLTLAERDDAFRYGQLAQQGTQFGQTLGLQRDAQSWQQQYQDGQFTLAQQQAAQDEAFRREQLYGQSTDVGRAGWPSPPSAISTGAPMLTLAARQQLADQQFRQQQLAQQDQTAGMEDAYRYAALSQQGGIANAQLSAQQQQAAMEDAYRRAALQQQGQIAGADDQYRYAALGQQGQIAGQQNQYQYAALGQQNAQSQQQNMLQRAQQILEAQKYQGQLELGTNQLNSENWFRGEQLGQNRYTTDQETALRSRGYDVQEGLGYAGINAQQNAAQMSNEYNYAALQSGDQRAADANAYNYASLDQRMQEFLTNLGMGQQTFNQNAYQFEQTNALAQQSADDRAEYYDMLGQAKTQPPINPFDPQMLQQLGLVPTGAEYGPNGMRLNYGLPTDPTKSQNMDIDNRRAALIAYVRANTDSITGQYKGDPAYLEALASFTGVTPTPPPAGGISNPFSTITTNAPPWYKFGLGDPTYQTNYSGALGANRYTDLRITQ